MKEEQIKPKASRRKDITNIREETDKIEYVNINKIDKSLTKG